MLALGLLLLGLAWRWLAADQAGVSQILLGVASLLVALPVARSAWDSLRHPSLHGVTDQLIALAMLGAWASGDLLTAALLPIIMIFGHVLEERSVIGSQEAIAALGELTRSHARRIEADGSLSEVDNASLRAGDQVEVRAGDRVPADGRVLQGQASLDTAPITGESVPLEVAPGMEVYGGAINLDGLLRIEITRTGEASTLGKVIGLMQQAERAKPPITRLLERYAGQYMLLVLLIAAVTWFVTNDAQAMLAVLVAACPCALVLSAPATAIAGIAVAARHGILIRSSAFLEELADLTSLVVDKTGTLTHGSLRLQALRLADAAEEASVLRLAASLGAASSHPVSRALAALAAHDAYHPLSDIRERQGFGVVARTAAGEAALGRPELFQQLGIDASEVPEHEGPIAGIALDGRFLGWLLLADSVRAEAAEALADLRELGLGRQLLLTGDRRAVADAVAKQVGIRQLVAQALPEDKLRQVGAEIGSGFRPMVVGDGINDSLALKAGVVGVAMGAGGADIALASADIVLIGSDLRRLGTCVRLSRQCRRTLQVNVAIGLGWTLAIVAAAAFGLLGAAGAMVAAAAQPQHLAGAGQCRTPAAFRGAPRAAPAGRGGTRRGGYTVRQAQTRRNGWRWLALAVGTLSALSLAEASMARWPAGWQVSDLPAAQPGQAGAGQRQRAVKLQADGSQALVMEVTRMPLQSGQAVNLEKVLGHMRKLVQIEFLRNGLQTACTSPQPSTTGGLAALETTCTIRQRGAVVMKQTLLTAAGKTSAYSLSYAGLAEAYDASQAEIRAVRESLRFE
ncbi:Cadmium, zinc and cobalt-transporting ATPase [Pseudomonas aeruginosa]|nr:Cadmium, zinc and cobalt-transporting ATPase [Pseudomonas aeruginosa]